MTQVIDTPHGCFKIHGPSNYAWIKQQLLDARRYQWVRNHPYIQICDWDFDNPVPMDDAAIDAAMEKTNAIIR